MASEVNKVPEKFKQTELNENKEDGAAGHPDPFKVRLMFNARDYLSMLVVLVLLVPLRFCVALVSLVLA